MNVTVLAKSETAEPVQDPAEVETLAAWMWATAARAGGVPVEDVSDEAWQRLGGARGFWRAHARGYLVDLARRGA